MKPIKFCISVVKYPDNWNDQIYSEYKDKEVGNRFHGVEQRGNIKFGNRAFRRAEYKKEETARKYFNYIAQTEQVDEVYLHVFYDNAGIGIVKNGHWWSQRKTDWHKKYSDYKLEKFFNEHPEYRK